MTAVIAINLHETERAEGKKGAQGNTIPPYYLAFFLFLTAINVNQMGIIGDSKEVQAFHDQEAPLLAELAALKFTKLPDGAGPATIHKVNEENKEIAQLQANIQQQLLQLRQGGQVKLTSTNTSMNVLQQIAGMTATILSATHTIYQLIQKLAPVNIA